MRARLLLAAAACALAAGCPSSIDWESGRSYPCDGGTGQCPGGWTCGITGICQPTTPGPYPCLQDQHCVSPWRCGADQLCVDPTNDALPTDLPSATPSASRVHPRLFTAPEQLSISPVTSLSGGRLGRSVAELSDGQLTLAVHAQDALTRADGGTADLAFATIPAAQVADGPVLAVASARRRALVLYDGGVGQFAPFTSGLPAVTRLALPFTASGLHVTNDADPDTLVVAHDGRQLAVWSLDDDAGFRVSQLPLSRDGGTLALWDVASLASTPLPELVLVATDEGLFAGDRADAGATDPLRWFGLTIGDFLNGPCNAWRYTKLAERVVSAQRLLLLEATALGTDERRLEALSQDQNERSRLQLVSSGCLAYPPPPPPLSQLFSLPSPCSGAAPVTAISTVRNLLGETDYRVQCADGTSYVTVNLGTPFADFSFDLQSAITSGDVSFGDGFVLDNGRLWASSVALVAAPITPGDSPAVVLGSGDGLRLVDSTPSPIGRQLKVYRPAENAGLFLEPRTETLSGEPLAWVEGTRDWVLIERSASPQRLQVVSLGELAATPQNAGVVAELPTTEEFKQPYRALLAPISDGGTELLVTAFDALLAADVTRLLSTSGAPVVAVDVKAVPLSRSPILSIAAVPPRTGEVASGYLLTPSSLFRFGAQSQSRWRVEEILMPRDDWKAVWADGARGRVGYPDGVIYSLPSRVPISQALPASDPPPGEVHAYAQVCGQPFALTTQGLLMQLVPSAPPDPLGQWQAVLPFQVAFGAPSDFRLHADGSTLYVVDGQLTVGAYQVPCTR